MRLREDDEVVGLDVLKENQHVLAVTNKGYGKQTIESEYRQARRGGLGVKTINLNDRIGELESIAAVDGDEDIMVVTDGGVIIRFSINDVSVTGRSTQGVRLMRLDDSHDVATVAVVKDVEKDIEDEEQIEENE